MSRLPPLDRRTIATVRGSDVVPNREFLRWLESLSQTTTVVQEITTSSGTVVARYHAPQSELRFASYSEARSDVIAATYQDQDADLSVVTYLDAPSDVFYAEYS